MLRYQNKYATCLQNSEVLKAYARVRASVAVEDDARKKLENEIKFWYDRFASSLKEENKRLTAVVEKATDENSLLNTD